MPGFVGHRRESPRADVGIAAAMPPSVGAPSLLLLLPVTRLPDGQDVRCGMKLLLEAKNWSYLSKISYQLGLFALRA